MKRQKLNSGYSKRLFTNTAGARHVHSRNIRSGVMRGGIRM